MDRSVVDPWVATALGFVPEGSPCQMELRMILNSRFRNHLGPNPEHPSWSVAQTVRAAVQSLGCGPEFDPALLALSWPAG